MFNDKNAILLLECRMLFAETLAQVHHRNDLAAQVDHALEIVRSVGHSGNLRHADDLVQGSDGHAIGLASHPKAHDMEFTAHNCSSPFSSPVLKLVLVLSCCRTLRVAPGGELAGAARILFQ